MSQELVSKGLKPPTTTNFGYYDIYVKDKYVGYVVVGKDSLETEIRNSLNLEPHQYVAKAWGV